MREKRIIRYLFAMIAALIVIGAQAHAQAALLIEEPYGFFGEVNPTGHNAIYFERICAENPVTLRRCQPGELGAVIARYEGLSGYDWLAIPLVPYLYSVENASSVPARVNRATVNRLRNRYHEAHLLELGEDLPAGGLTHGGWTELIGAAYERRIYALRFNTTETQDDAFIAMMNDRKNITEFKFITNNCADFSRSVLNFYFSDTFHRNLLPDGGITTPKLMAYKLERYIRNHSGQQLAVYEIPQVPGFRRRSHANHGVVETFIDSGIAIPIAFVSPYVAGGLFWDYFARGRYKIIPKHPTLLTPATLDLLNQHSQPSLASLPEAQNAGNDAAPISNAASIGLAESQHTGAANNATKGMRNSNE